MAACSTPLKYGDPTCQGVIVTITDRMAAWRRERRVLLRAVIRSSSPAVVAVNTSEAR